MEESNSPEKVGDSPMFAELSADGESATEIESLCVQCFKNGTTRLLLTRIPHFREVIVMSFTCPHCGFRNAEAQFGGSVMERGCTYTLNVEGGGDRNRQVVKSEYAHINIPELELEIPPQTQKGVITTVEGVLSRVEEGLIQDQETRRDVDPESYEKVEAFLQKLRNLEKFTFILEDPTGNSYIESLVVGKPDRKLKITHFDRPADWTMETPEDAEKEGGTGQHHHPKHLTGALLSGEFADRFMQKMQLKEEKESKSSSSHHESSVITPEEVMSFSTICPSCHEPIENRMIVANIPHFRDVILMSISCEHCGYKSREVKCAGAISDKGKHAVLQVRDEEDLKRDVLKSDSCTVSVPEVNLEICTGTLGGIFTTVEGLLRSVEEELKRTSQFAIGDSATDADRMKQFFADLDDLCNLKKPFTLDIRDPLGNSYIQNPYAPDPDEQLFVEEYVRSWEEDEDLGLHDMDTKDA
eukprot:TRINITY_DN1376_c0_g1_i2.p1 TRINITY_DN1376_c0_g1~~TRINITY_DN1376_c0_g1_i2.p1  ORF type:complete len:470 (+),score=110.34 TRINITY_DN1376_c0_g1_i2:116-1525(+)